MKGRRFSKLGYAAAGVFFLMVLGLVSLFHSEPDAKQLLRNARKALLQQKFNVALQTADQILKTRPTNPAANMVAAVAASELQRFEDAIRYCTNIPEQEGSVFVDARCMAGNLALNFLNWVSVAEIHYRAANRADPTNVLAADRLAYLLSLQAQSQELIPLQLHLIRLGAISFNRVLSIVQHDLLYPQQALLEKLRHHEPDNSGLILAAAKQPLLSGDDGRAKVLINEALRLNPTLTEAHAQLGLLLADDGTTLEMLAWQRNLPPAATNHPDVWIALGQLALRQQKDQVAARCFWEAGRIDAASQTANYLLGQQLARQHRPDDAKPFLHRALMLERYRKLFGNGNAPATDSSTDDDLLNQATRLAKSLGLIHEAFGFAKIASQRSNPSDWALEEVRLLQPSLATLPLTRTISEANIFTSIDGSKYPLPDQNITDTGKSNNVEGSRHTPVEFNEIAETVGLTFQYNNGFDETISGAQRPYDFVGGGIAVIDFDVDGWPDVCFAQGCVLGNESSTPDVDDSDRLYRNQRGLHFEDVTSECLPFEQSYGQGLASGDFNKDRFPDLLVSNLGKNRLLRNNGDGTFTDVSHTIRNDAERWTTSCLICDLNQDSIPDLYTVNYLSGDIIDRICRDQTGRIASCAPQDFPAAQDQLHLGTGNGNFVDVTSSIGVEGPDGKGLGIVVGDLDSDRQLEIVIANDGVPNFYFAGFGTDDSARFSESAMIRGLAVNHHGQSEACMGIALEDLDQDGHSDLVITNFTDETHTLYQGSITPGYFTDQTRQSGLGESSLKMLGFGIQAVDADLDGLSDLVVANGHVDDFRDRNVAYRMVPTYYHNLGHLRFREAARGEVGEYFQRQHLGRCVARLDWNRDGAEDVIIGHLHERYALLQNTTRHRGHYVATSLLSLDNESAATGSNVSATTSEMNVCRQLTMGGGYLASNQRTLIFGLGATTPSVRLSVQWQNQVVDDYAEVMVDSEIAIVEGRSQVYSVPK